MRYNYRKPMTPLLATIVAALLVPTLAGVVSIVIQLTHATDKLAEQGKKLDDIHDYSHDLYHKTLGPMVQEHELRLAVIETRLSIGRES